MNSALLRYLLCCCLVLSPLVHAEAQTTPTARKAPEKTVQAFKVTARVDTRVELLSIVARLAGYEEYSNNDFKSYTDDVDRYFAKYKQHLAVQYAVKVRASNSIGFDAVMSMAVHLNPAPALTPRIPFTDKMPDSRWGKAAAEEFARLLQQFYKDANCAGFFQSHAEMYRTAEGRYQQLLNNYNS